jgi:transposase-like protein
MSKSYAPRKQYDRDFKLNVVELVLSGQMSAPEARDAFGIKCRTSITKWIRQLSPAETTKTVSKSTKQDPKLLEERIKALEYQLYLEKIRTEGLNIMIDLAEKHHNISIRKKSSTKQSKK